MIGKAPELIKNFIEIRGIGILDIAKVYGIGSVRDTKIINMVVQFDEWKADNVYDRLGLENEYIEILDVKVPKLSIPVKPGRNLAVILEAAARNYRTREMDTMLQKSWIEDLWIIIKVSGYLLAHYT